MYRNVQTDEADVGSKHAVSGDLEQSFLTKPVGQDFNLVNTLFIFHALRKLIFVIIQVKRGVTHPYVGSLVGLFQ